VVERKPVALAQALVLHRQAVLVLAQHKRAAQAQARAHIPQQAGQVAPKQVADTACKRHKAVVAEAERNRPLRLRRLSHNAYWHLAFARKPRPKLLFLQEELID